MDRNEMRKIAEGIARDPKSYPSARVSALRFLRELDAESDAEHDAFADPRRAGAKASQQAQLVPSLPDGRRRGN